MRRDEGSGSPSSEFIIACHHFHYYYRHYVFRSRHYNYSYYSDCVIEALSIKLIFPTLPAGPPVE